MVKTDIMPKTKYTVISLVTAAGVDTSDWNNYKGYAASNPKYCFEWSFVEKGKVVVLNLWYHNIVEKGNELIVRTNMRKAENINKKITIKRARKMDEAIQTAVKEQIPIRVIICKKKNGLANKIMNKASQVDKRELDPEPWGILRYNFNTGNCVLKRGIILSKIIDQYSVENAETNNLGKKEIITSIYGRDSRVRKNVRDRSKGRCEKCGKLGFFMQNHGIYIETHHITPLCKEGIDNESNVIALCPDHHREAHYSINSESIKKELEKTLRMTKHR